METQRKSYIQIQHRDFRFFERMRLLVAVSVKVEDMYSEKTVDIPWCPVWDYCYNRRLNWAFVKKRWAIHPWEN